MAGIYGDRTRWLWLTLPAMLAWSGCGEWEQEGSDESDPLSQEELQAMMDDAEGTAQQVEALRGTKSAKKKKRPSASCHDHGGVGRPCSTSRDCYGGKVCVHGFCRHPGTGATSERPTPHAESGPPSCTYDEDCAPGEYCAPELEVCLRRPRSRTAPTETEGEDGTCRTDRDCSRGEFCNILGECTPERPAPTADERPRGTVASCRNDFDCGEGEHCSARRCVPLPD